MDSDHTSIEILPHDGKPVTKMAISPESKYIVTYSQECKNFVGWNVADIIKYDTEWPPGNYINPDFKVSDEMIVIINKEHIYKKNGEEIHLNKKEKKEKFDLKYEFLTNGDIVACHNRAISIYSFRNNWKCRAEYKLRNAKIFDIGANNKLPVSVNGITFILELPTYSLRFWKFELDLPTFQYWEVLLDKTEGMDIEKIMLKSSNDLMVMNIDGIHRIYSNSMHVPIGKFIDYDSQDFGIVGDNDEYIITLSNDKMINIHSWKQNLRRSVNLNSLLALKNIDPNNFIYIEFKGNNATLYSYRNEPRIINMTTGDWKTLLKNSDQDNDIQNSKIEKVDYNLNIASQLLEEGDDVDDKIKKNNSLYKNIFYNVEKLITGETQFTVNKDQFIENYIIPSLKTFDIFQNTEEQKEYDLRYSEQEFTLKAISNSRKTVISSYNTKFGPNWKHHKVNNNISIILYECEDDEDKLYELRIYTFNTKIKRIQLQDRFNIGFLEYAIKLYNNSKLNNENDRSYSNALLSYFRSIGNIFTLDDDGDNGVIDEIAKYTENDGLKKQWILYVLNQKKFLVCYGKMLLKSAIEQNNIELIDIIINKTLQYFKENPNLNIYVLSIICNNINQLSQKYPDSLLKYDNEMILFIDSSNQNIIYNNFDHIHSFYIGLNTQIQDFSIFRSFINFFKSVIAGCLEYIWIMFSCYMLWPVLAIFMAFPPSISSSNIKDFKPKLKLIVPFPDYVTYPKINSKWFILRYFLEIFFKPKSSSAFSQVQFNEFYKTWNGEAIINYKWRIFGRYYYAGIWLLYTIFLICFTLATSVSSKIINEKEREYLLVVSIILGFIQLSFEIQQFILHPSKWIFNGLNWLDLGAYLLPIMTSAGWISLYLDPKMFEQKKLIPFASISCLLLDIKFVLFFRAFESFGIYFAIILGVGRRIFSFLLIIFLIIISFAHAFFVLLKPKDEFSEDVQGDLNDTNNPWVLTTKYHQISEDGTMINPKATLVQEPDEYTNLFSSYHSALLSVYLFLTGDRNSLAAWSPKDNPVMIILMIIFSFVIVVYLMNLFIGLLNMAIEKDNDRASYLAEKAEILKEIELFYLFPCQRYRKDWFPDFIYYYADVSEARKVVKKLIDEGTWNTSSFSENRETLSKLLAIENT